MDWTPEGIVERGLPPAPPPPLELDEDIPVALWKDAETAGVLVVSHDNLHGDEEDPEPWSQYICLLVASPHGWASTGGDPGSSWPVPYGERPAGNLPTLTGFYAGQTLEDGRALWFASGIAPEGVERVGAAIGDETVEVDCEPNSGAFLLRVPHPSWDGPLSPVEISR